MEMKRKVKRYSKEMIHQIVQEVESGASRKEVCEKYGIGLSTLDEWLPRYASKEFRATTKPFFTDQQRRTIIRNVSEGRMTIEEANVAYRIKGIGTIKRWIRESKRHNPDIGLNPSLMCPFVLRRVSCFRDSGGRCIIDLLENERAQTQNPLPRDSARKEQKPFYTH